MNSTGFVSSFPSPVERRMLHRSKLAIPSRYAERLLKGEISNIAETARRHMRLIVDSELNRFPSKMAELKQKTLEHVGSFSGDDIGNIYSALLAYQDLYGNNYLMNVACLGYKKLDDYLHDLDEKYKDPTKINAFLEIFNDKYNDTVIMDELGLKYSRERLENEIIGQAQILDHFLKTAPRLSGVSLLKGAGGLDEPLSTQVHGSLLAQSLLYGQGLRFNGFLSTTSSYEVADNFCFSEIGDPLYAIDLTNNSDESEVLRRDTLHALNDVDFETENILFSFNAHNVAGVSVKSIKNAAESEESANALDDEDEILLAPGHSFTPEKVVRMENGFIVIGTLTYEEG
ncbi:hypothetical protein [Kosakonia oryzae]|uniref:Uncharacterized protein n=2 Tax=Kosakonia oryzae TaxID=497725 RepID=A0ABN4Q3F7_9ENTR|nr:hypothetical protein [Kosakonia oryzae]ANI81290.2 hypothetical protein AWR26_03655 [Kosakonia oryzae]